jgi:hypothetical protein
MHPNARRKLVIASLRQKRAIAQRERTPRETTAPERKDRALGLDGDSPK